MTVQELHDPMAWRYCWWCGHGVVVDTSAGRSNGLLRDDSRMDGRESWICADPADCVRHWRQQA
jgi:hypothetical protein